EPEPAVLVDDDRHPQLLLPVVEVRNAGDLGHHAQSKGFLTLPDPAEEIRVRLDAIGRALRPGPAVFPAPTRKVQPANSVDCLARLVGGALVLGIPNDDAGMVPPL